MPSVAGKGGHLGNDGQRQQTGMTCHDDSPALTGCQTCGGRGNKDEGEATEGKGEKVSRGAMVLGVRPWRMERNGKGWASAWSIAVTPL